MNAEQTIDTAKSLQRVQNYLERLEVAKGYHKECIHAFIDKDGAEIPLLATDLKAILQQVAATHPTQQGLELANCKGGKWLTVVYRDIQPGDEPRTIGEHPKVSALSWSHALHDRDATLAAQAKRGGAAMTHHTDDQYLMDAVLICPHTITHESITLHFSPKQKEGHNALAQLRHRLVAADAAAKAREMELLAVIEDLERLIPLVNRGGTP